MIRLLILAISTAYMVILTMVVPILGVIHSVKLLKVDPTTWNYVCFIFWSLGVYFVYAPLFDKIIYVVRRTCSKSERAEVKAEGETITETDEQDDADESKISRR